MANQLDQTLQPTVSVFGNLRRIRDGSIWADYRLTGLPGVLLVDDEGAVTFKLMRIDSYDQLLGLVRDHTGVAVGLTKLQHQRFLSNIKTPYLH